MNTTELRFSSSEYEKISKMADDPIDLSDIKSWSTIQTILNSFNGFTFFKNENYMRIGFADLRHTFKDFGDMRLLSQCDIFFNLNERGTKPNKLVLKKHRLYALGFGGCLNITTENVIDFLNLNKKRFVNEPTVQRLIDRRSKIKNFKEKRLTNQ